MHIPAYRLLNIDHFSASEKPTKYNEIDAFGPNTLQNKAHKNFAVSYNNSIEDMCSCIIIYNSTVNKVVGYCALPTSRM